MEVSLVRKIKESGEIDCYQAASKSMSNAIAEWCLTEGFDETVYNVISSVVNNGSSKFGVIKSKLDIFKNIFKMSSFSTEEYIAFINKNKSYIIQRNIKEISSNLKTNIAIFSALGLDIRPNLSTRDCSAYFFRKPEEMYAVLMSLHASEKKEHKKAEVRNRKPRKKFLTPENTTRFLVYVSKDVLDKLTEKYKLTPQKKALINCRFESLCRARANTESQKVYSN